jgi:pimeloyl-ACP methyl ester carboxylesterase
VAQDRLPYLAYPFSHPGTSFAFEDGYLLSPWGRGNQWYRGIAETDIWEGLNTVKSLLRVDENRQYLCGQSMGGYGAWHIAHRSANVWAALGVHAGALWYDQQEVTSTVASELRDLPTYFVVGTSDRPPTRSSGTLATLNWPSSPSPEATTTDRRMSSRCTFGCASSTATAAGRAGRPESLTRRSSRHRVATETPEPFVRCASSGASVASIRPRTADGVSWWTYRLVDHLRQWHAPPAGKGGTDGSVGSA